MFCSYAPSSCRLRSYSERPLELQDWSGLQRREVLWPLTLWWRHFTLTVVGCSGQIGVEACPQPPPQPPLRLPLQARGNGPDLPLLDRVTALHRRRQEQDVFLDVRREVEQGHDLRHSCPGHMPESGDVGVVLDVALLHQLFEPNSPSHEPADLRNSARRWGRSRFRLLAHGHALAPMPYPRESHLTFNRD